MAEKIAQDPAFAQMTAALQQSMGGQPGAAPEAAAGPAGFDTSKYMEAMGGVLQNPQFMDMAEKLGQQIMQVPRGCCRLRQAATLCLHIATSVPHGRMRALYCAFGQPQRQQAFIRVSVAGN